MRPRRSEPPAGVGVHPAMSLRLRCTHCGTTQEKPDRFLGKELFCRSCKQWFPASSVAAVLPDERSLARWTAARDRAAQQAELRSLEERLEQPPAPADDPRAVAQTRRDDLEPPAAPAEAPA